MKSRPSPIASRDDARDRIAALRADAESFVGYPGRTADVRDKQRRVTLAIIDYGFNRGMTRFGLAGRDLARLVGLPHKTAHRNMLAVAALRRFFTWSGKPNQRVRGSRARKSGRFRLCVGEAIGSVTQPTGSVSGPEWHTPTLGEVSVPVGTDARASVPAPMPPARLPVASATSSQASTTVPRSQRASYGGDVSRPDAEHVVAAYLGALGHDDESAADELRDLGATDGDLLPTVLDWWRDVAADVRGLQTPARPCPWCGVTMLPIGPKWLCPVHPDVTDRGYEPVTVQA